MTNIPPDAKEILDRLKQVPDHLADFPSKGQGDYTQERHEWLDKTPLEDILTSMKQRPEDDTNQYDEIIE